MDYVILAGYLKLIPGQLCRAFKRRILNIHPGLLPSFGGKGYYGVKARAAAAVGRGCAAARAAAPAATQSTHAPIGAPPPASLPERRCTRR